MNYSASDSIIQQGVTSDNARVVFNKMAILGRLRMMKWMIAQGFRVNLEEALFMACDNGHFRVVNYLISRQGVDAGGRDRDAKFCTS